MLAAVFGCVPPAPAPYVLDEREAHLGVGHRHAAIGLNLAVDLDRLAADVIVAVVGESNDKRRSLVFAHVNVRRAKSAALGIVIDEV